MGPTTSRVVSLDQAWEFVDGWTAKTRSERTKTFPNEDAVVVASCLLQPNADPITGRVVGKASFLAFGDLVDVVLYDPRRMQRGITAYHENGMPMRGLLSTRRIFEADFSSHHIGVDGELYPVDRSHSTVGRDCLDVMKKLAVLDYFQARVNATL